jgi:hypothetical protein
MVEPVDVKILSLIAFLHVLVFKCDVSHVLWWSKTEKVYRNPFRCMIISSNQGSHHDAWVKRSLLLFEPTTGEIGLFSRPM